MASDENDKQNLTTTIIIITIIVVIFIIFGIMFAFRGQMAASDQVGLGYANIGAQQAVGIAESQRFANNPELRTVVGDNAKAMPIIST